MLEQQDRLSLLVIARESIEQSFYHRQPRMENIRNSVALIEPRTSFVTLKHDGLLRGCIGTLEAVRRLCDDVAHNARAAAFHDPRFPPLTASETEQLQIEISVLQKPELLSIHSRNELLNSLQPDIDGLIVEAGMRRATFLPSVWETLSDPEAFVTHLWKKAGLDPDDWPAGIRLYRYGAEHFDEHNTGLPA